MGSGLAAKSGQAALWFRRSAAGNLAHAQATLGTMHKLGEGGLDVNHVEGVRLFALSAAQGYHLARPERLEELLGRLQAIRPR